MAWLYRVVELPDGGWSCRFGLEVYDRHDDLDEAIAHCRGIASGNPPSELIVHSLGGDWRRVASF